MKNNRDSELIKAYAESARNFGTEFVIRVGIDAHKDSLSLCGICPLLAQDKDIVLLERKVPNDATEVQKFINDIMTICNVKPHMCDVKTAYESGGLGYSLHRELRNLHINNEILAVSTMMKDSGASVTKNDRMDARRIAHALAHHTAHSINVLDEEDEATRDYIRMRDDYKTAEKKNKQQILALVSRCGFTYPKSYWTQDHLKWLQNLTFSQARQKDALDEYLRLLKWLEEQIDRFDAEIKKMADEDRYKEQSKKMMCFMGIKEKQAVEILSEVGNFDRFQTATSFANFIGLVPGEHSSGNDTNSLPITKRGNSRLRTLFVECAQSISKGRKGYKSKELLRRQNGMDPDVVAYADRGNERLKLIYWNGYHKHAKHPNLVKTRMARELACFVWGMMTNNLQTRGDSMKGMAT